MLRNSLFLVLMVLLLVTTPATALAWSHCGTPAAEVDCATPVPTPAPYVAPTMVPTAPPTAPPVASVQPTQGPTQSPLASPTAAAPTQTTQTSSQSSTTAPASPGSPETAPQPKSSVELVCVVSQTDTMIHTDVVRTSDANGFLADHPNAHRPPLGGNCGPTDIALVPTSKPAAIVNVAAVASPTPAPTVAPTLVPASPSPEATPEATLPPAPSATPEATPEPTPTIEIQTPPDTGYGDTATEIVP